MLEKLDSSSAGARSADVCVVGAGPAGISLSLALARTGISSVLLEGGLLDGPGSQGQDAYAGEVTGLAYALAASRLRFFGGTSNHWGGWSKPLDPVDFTRRPSAPLPSWPFGPAELAGDYAAASRWCELGSEDFDAGSSVATPARELLFPDSDAFATQIFRFSPPTRFGARYREEVTGNPLVQGIYNANAVAMTHQGDAIRSLTAVSPEGDRLEVSADRFVLAMGGIENARFLMHCSAAFGTPAGNASGLLGRCFMDHFGFHPGYLAAAEGLKHFRYDHDGASLMPVVTATRAFQEELDLPSICLMATPEGPHPNLPAAYFANPGILGASLAQAGRYRLQLIVEPTAHAESHLALSDDRDAFGIPRVRLNWHIMERDYEDTERFLRRLERALGVGGLGRLQRTRRFEGDLRLTLSTGMHHMGTTRMSDDSRWGVVDPQCRVWDSANLFIAGSSVFPRVGYSNPTLTIVALAERLARHMAKEA